MSKFVMGTYTNTVEAREMIDQLLRDGYPNDSISVLADETIVPALDTLGVTLEDGYDFSNDGETTWERIKDFFGFGDYDDTIINTHQRELRDGRILVMVDCDKVPDTLQAVAEEKDTWYWNDTKEKAQNNLDDLDDDTIRLQEERMNVGKERVRTGEVTIKKHVVEETRTVDVPVMHEEVVIERTPVSGMQAGDADFDEDTITIPLMEEQVYVTKEPVVTEEVHVRKRDVSDTKKVSGTVRREELDVDKAGNVVIEGMDNQSPSARL